MYRTHLLAKRLYSLVYSPSIPHGYKLGTEVAEGTRESNLSDDICLGKSADSEEVKTSIFSDLHLLPCSAALKWAADHVHSPHSIGRKNNGSALTFSGRFPGKISGARRLSFSSAQARLLASLQARFQKRSRVQAATLL